MAKDITLHWASGSPPCWRVIIALEEKNLKGYNQKLLSFDKGEQKEKETLDINPRGQVPAFKHGNNIVNESIAACLYLESQFKSRGPSLIPDSSEEQALMYQRMIEILNLQQRLADVVLYTRRIPEEERHDSAVKRNREALSAEFKLWESYMHKGGPYMAGKNFTLADVIVFPPIAFSLRLGLSQERYPKLTEYYNLAKERPSIKATWPKHWLENPQGMDLFKDL
ncbi:glutathione S-transferase A-like [Chanos chanos]|uniref:Glutathione S-transferase A-like n=1 Tax=Chanos chanos TaxID=29144 RepID=A0A6J2WIT5_CHACN|nr:glutathione S-transferase A-like [Chanos chanos]